MDELHNLKIKVNNYNKILENTRTYRQVWKDSLKAFIVKRLEIIVAETGLDAKVEIKENVDNLEAVVLSLGTEVSGISEKINEDTMRPMIKNNGVLIYQQLFNGKVQVMLVYPFIEGYGKPQPPKIVSIYRPEEVKEPFIIRHVEEFLKEVILWEDFDDDLPIQKQPIGFNITTALPEQ